MSSLWWRSARCGYLTAFIVMRNQWRDEMIKRAIACYDWWIGKWSGERVAKQALLG
jgi:hypothetical protein